ncbi:ABC transporter substrate-binding protein [Ruminiclostridium cellobioparum]|uniref:ABC-type sugar transport system, periplasmic component n=1 Tax=Ruminiclostridium cellobioparum subsp. termitidis CT1112 TaxID=1195236 RepID=S0FH52_RUMCE|nr:extracellular solute-binding protein [Ruminiclostridium cellobioparum]EMS70672.1 ABC-type sugar transport system, periplasmic component [Ruminiclostridium cellobioparum subsp. termitidis CT1112]
MIKKFRKAVSILIFCAVVFTVAALFMLNNPDSFFYSQSKQQSAGPSPKITFAYPANASAQIMEDLVNSFNRENNNIVEFQKISDDKYNETLNMLMASEKGPDVFFIDNQWVDTYARYDWLADLSESIDAGFLDRFPENSLRLSQSRAVKDRVYSISSGVITQRLLYNKALFREVGLDPEAPPKTLEEFVRYSQKIANYSLSDKKYSFAIPAAEENAGFVEAIEAAGTYSGLYYYDFKEGEYNLNNYAPWLKCILQLKEENCLLPGMTELRQSNIVTQFMEGNLAMMYASSSEIGELRANPDIEIGIAMPIAYDGQRIGKGAVIVRDTNMYAVNSAAKNMTGAVKLWKYLYSEKCIGELYRSCNLIPGMDNIINNPAYTPELQIYTQFIPSKADSHYQTSPAGVNEWSRFKTYASVLNGEKPVEEALYKETSYLNEQLNSLPGGVYIPQEKRKITDFDPRNPLKSVLNR